MSKAVAVDDKQAALNEIESAVMMFHDYVGDGESVAAENALLKPVYIPPATVLKSLPKFNKLISNNKRLGGDSGNHGKLFMQYTMLTTLDA